MTKKTQKQEPAEAGTGKIQGVGYKNPPIETRFKKGQSGNPKGRPKSFDQLRALAQQVAAENLGESGLTRIQAMLTAMSTSRNPRDRELFLQYAFGKVKDELIITDWREEARKQGYDPDAIESELEAQFKAAMVETSRSRSVPEGGGSDSGEQAGE